MINRALKSYKYLFMNEGDFTMIKEAAIDVTAIIKI